MEENKIESKRDMEKIIEIVIVVMLGLTALLMAWATWIGSLHAGNQATSYTVSNNLASEGNSEYNAAVQAQMQDMLLWNEVSDLQSELFFELDAETPDQNEIDLISYKIYFKLHENLTAEMAAQIAWPDATEGENPTDVVLSWIENEAAVTSPFYNEEFVNSYFDTALILLADSEAELEKGGASNTNGDAFGLVTVIYSVVLFLLGIASSLKSKNNKNIIVLFSLVSFLASTIYMFTIPIPDGFSIMSFFGG